MRKVYGLFVDVKRSVQYLKEHEKDFMFSDMSSNQATEKMDVE